MVGDFHKVMSEVLDCILVVSGFEPSSRYYIYQLIPLGNVSTSFYPSPAKG